MLKLPDTTPGKSHVEPFQTTAIRALDTIIKIAEQIKDIGTLIKISEAIEQQRSLLNNGETEKYRIFVTADGEVSVYKEDHINKAILYAPTTKFAEVYITKPIDITQKPFTQDEIDGIYLHADQATRSKIEELKRKLDEDRRVRNLPPSRALPTPPEEKVSIPTAPPSTPKIPKTRGGNSKNNPDPQMEH